MKVVPFTLPDNFEIRHIVDTMRATNKKEELTSPAKDFGHYIEKEIAPVILEKFGFSNIQVVTDRAADPFDIVAKLDERKFFINVKATAKPDGVISISSASLKDFLLVPDMDMEIAYLFMKLHDNSYDGFAVLLKAA